MAFLRGERNGALFFTVDTMIAAIVFTLAVIIIVSFFLGEEVTEDVQVVISNYNDYLVNTEMRVFLVSYRDVYTDARNAKSDLAVYEQVAYLHNTGKADSARSFVENITNILVPGEFGVQYKLDDTVIYSRGSGFSPNSNLSSEILTYFIDKDDVVQGINITRVSIWI